MTVAELQERMSAEEFDDWRAYDLYVQPIGDQRLARQLALLSAQYGNTHRGNHPAMDIDDMDLYHERPAPPTQAEEEERFRAAWMARGLVIVKGGKA